MTELISQTVLFSQTGEPNTLRTLELARSRAESLGLRTVLVATSSGATGARAAHVFKGYDLIAVSHSAGFKAPNTQELTEENRRGIESAGARILTATHAFGGVNRAVRKKLNTYELDEIIAQTLRIFGEGMKVVAEIAMMAADAGLVAVNQPAIAIAGTSSGADTAVVLLPVNSQAFFDLKVLEIICRPAPGHPALISSH